MDAIEFVEKVSGVKLLDYQKKLIRYIEEHPDCKIVMGRWRTRNYDFMTMYYICNSILNEKEKEEV